MASRFYVPILLQWVVTVEEIAYWVIVHADTLKRRLLVHAVPLENV
jgi:hypothetical protein